MKFEVDFIVQENGSRVFRACTNSGQMFYNEMISIKKFTDRRRSITSEVNNFLNMISYTYGIRYIEYRGYDLSNHYKRICKKIMNKNPSIVKIGFMDYQNDVNDFELISTNEKAINAFFDRTLPLTHINIL
jgi:hypothetical protein